jgi:hypothetical protein
VQKSAEQEPPVELTTNFKVTPHVLRRTFAYIKLIENALGLGGMDLVTLEGVMGQESLKTTRGYLADRLLPEVDQPRRHQHAERSDRNRQASQRTPRSWVAPSTAPRVADVHTAFSLRASKQERSSWDECAGSVDGAQLRRHSCQLTKLRPPLWWSRAFDRRTASSFTRSWR